MDKIIDDLRKVQDLEQYTFISNNLTNNFKNTDVNIDLLKSASVLCKVRTLEIEYYNKYHEIGAACFVFERLLSLPNSNTWECLNKDLIPLLQYWLFAIILRLQSNNIWWNFLKVILISIKKIRGIHYSFPDKLLRLTARSLFTLGTKDCFNAQQRHEIIHCLNIYCAESNKEVRCALRHKFTDYFTELARQLCTCGYFPLQFSVLETLVRWMVPRKVNAIRAMAADHWFPSAICPPTAKKIFLESAWTNFFNDARSFLNALNTANGLVTSVKCKTLFVGEIGIITGAENKQTWLDINTGIRSVSVLMDSRVLNCVGYEFRACETLVIETGSTRSACLHSNTGEITLSVEVYHPPCVQPCGLAVGAGRDVIVTATISCRTDLRSLDNALRDVFGEKYQVQMDIDDKLTLSPITASTRHHRSSSEDSHFSIPVQFNRRKHPGGRSVRAASPKSTASTSSLARLHENLAVQPYVGNGGEYYLVGTEPQLSTVSEISDTDDLHSIQFTSYTVGVARYKTSKSTQKRGSESEYTRQGQETNKSVLSCVAVATHGTYLPEKIGILERKSFAKNNPCPVVIKSTTDDEADTDVILDTPTYVNTKRNKSKHTLISKSEPQKTNVLNIDAQHVENIFSRHIVASKTGQTEISPTLARKINASSSNSSISFDENCLNVNEELNVNINQPETIKKEVIKCLDDMVDKVCNDLFQYLNSKETRNQNDNAYNTILCKSRKINKNQTKTPKKKTKPVLKQKERTKKITKEVSKKDKKSTSAAKKIKNKNAVVEQSNEEVLKINSSKRNTHKIQVDNVNIPITNKVNESLIIENSTAKRKRKLYSPKDDEVNKEVIGMQLSSENDNIALSNLKTCGRFETPKTSTFYTEIEKERKKYIRKSRPKILRGNFEKSPSPTTLQNDAIFDKLKSTIENNEKFIVVDTKSAVDVYNFTSGSEDSDYDIRRTDLKKRKRTKPGVSSESSMTVKTTIKTRRNRNTKSSNIQTNKKTRKAQKPPGPKKTRSTTNINNQPANELQDEKMRNAALKEVMHTSIIAAKPNFEKSEKVDLVLKTPLQMETITDDEEVAPKKTTRTKLFKESKPEQSLKKTKGSSNSDSDSGTRSPLPGLIVGSPTRRDDTILNAEAMKRVLQQINKDPDALSENSDTHNMLLSEIESNCQQNNSLNTSDKIGFLNEKTIRVDRDTPKKRKINEPIANSLKDSKKDKRYIYNVVDDEIIDVDVESEKSISTNGIHAHADSDEQPPSLRSLKKHIPPREIVDMKECLQKDYLALNRQLYDSNRQRHDRSKEDNMRLVFDECSISSSKASKSPPIVNQFLTSSQTTSDSSNPTSPNKNIQDKRKSAGYNKTNSKDYPKKQESKRNETSDYVKPKEKSPIVSLNPLSCKEINRWSKPGSLKSRIRMDANEDLNETRTPFVSKTWETKKIVVNVSDNEESESSAGTTDFNRITNKAGNRTPTKNSPNNTKDSTDSNKSVSGGIAKKPTKKKRPSVISPINMEDFADIIASNSTTRKDSERITPTRFKPAENFPQIFHSPDRCIENQSSKESENVSAKLSSPKMSGTKLPTKSNSPIVDIFKTMRNEIDANVILEGVPSVSNLSDWLQRNDTSAKDKDFRATMKDILVWIKEKLKTSLTESNNNTMQAILQSHLDAQTQLTIHEEQLKVASNAAMAANAAANNAVVTVKVAVNDAMAAVAKSNDAVVAVKDCDNKIKELKERMKKNFTKAIHEDSKQRKLIVVMMKEDINAALRHMRQMKPKDK